MSIYQDEGYNNRDEYLKALAEEYGIEKEFVYSLAELYGQSEDFDGLVTACEDCAKQLKALDELSDSVWTDDIDSSEGC